MSIQKNGSANTPPPVTFPNATTTLEFGAIGDSEDTQANVHYRISPSTPQVFFDNGTKDERVGSCPVGLSPARVSHQVTFKLGGPPTPLQIWVDAEISASNGGTGFHEVWGVVVTIEAPPAGKASLPGGASHEALIGAVVVDALRRTGHIVNPTKASKQGSAKSPPRKPSKGAPGRRPKT